MAEAIELTNILYNYMELTARLHALDARWYTSVHRSHMLSVCFHINCIPRGPGLVLVLLLAASELLYLCCLSFALKKDHISILGF